VSTFDSKIAAAAPLAPASPKRPGSDYGELLQEVRQAGLLDHRPLYYSIRVTLNAALYCLGWVAVILIGDSWWQMLTAVYLALVFGQTGFLGHDAGHRQIFRSRHANQAMGLIVGNLAIGLAFGWWVDKHHRHHINPNQEGLDPDIGGEGIAFTPAQAQARHGIGRWFAHHQAGLFFPLLTLEALQFHVSGWTALANRAYKQRGREALLLGAHTIGYFAVVFLVMSPGTAVAFIAVQQGLFGLYLGCAFAPNHKGMPLLGRDDELDFLRRQVLTSRNVRGGLFMDFFLGGLNYQVEHHLFPSMPSIALGRAQPIVRAFCEDRGLPYVETGLFESYGQALRYLRKVGRSADRPGRHNAAA
jgi:fatty acid desaturase